VSGQGFSAADTVDVFFDKMDIGSAVTDSSGKLPSRGLQVPTLAVPGTHWVTALDAGGINAQAPFVVSTPWVQSGYQSSRVGLNPFENLITPLNASQLIKVARGLATGPIRSSPAIGSGGVFVGSSDGDLYSFPPTACFAPPCSPTWKLVTGGAVTSSPLVSGASVYVGSADGDVYAVGNNCGTGGATCNPLWTGATGGAVEASPALGTYLYAGSDDGSLYAFKPGGCGLAQCSPVWSVPIGAKVQSSPALAWGNVYTASSDGTIDALNASTGALAWTAHADGPVVSSPAITGFVEYIGSEAGTLYAFNSLCGTGGATCSPLWTGTAGAPIESSPAVAYGDVYVGTDDGKLYAFSTIKCATPPCQPVWTATTGGPIVGAPAVAGGAVFVGSTDGKLYAFNARNGVQLWSFTIGSPVDSSPAVSNGFVYVGSDNGALYFFRFGNYPTPPPKPAPSSLVRLSTPIRHIVVVYEENHSFDDLLGALCVADQRCNGVTSGQISDGTTIPLGQSTDLVPNIDHTDAGQTTAVDGGKMDGFSKLAGCDSSTSYACYTQYQPSQIPNIAALARGFAVSDATFAQGLMASFGSHLDLLAGQTDNFTGDNPFPAPPGQAAPGWGCDSNGQAPWSATGPPTSVPACVPRQDGSGPFKASPVSWVPTILDRADAAGLPWRVYAGGTSVQQGTGYLWAACPYFADCIYGPQFNDLVPSTQVLADAASGNLPNLSFVQPSGPNSGHNGYSMLAADNWVGSVVSAIENGPEWRSTAIFITFDDCGCFYDHVPPPAGFGIREPMIIVSPYARAGYTDSTQASFASMLAYAEHTFGLPALTSADAGAYDFSQGFDYTQAPIAPVPLAHHRIPRWELGWIRAHPPDLNDPT